MTNPQTLIAYTGTAVDAPLVGGKDPVSHRILEVLWAGNTLAMAQQFQDGEIKKLQVTLKNPLVLEEGDRRERFGSLSHASIVDKVRMQASQEEGQWDGVVFVDTVDGMEVADVIVVFPQNEPGMPLSVDHAVKIIGTLRFDDEVDDWVTSPGFYDQEVVANETKTKNVSMDAANDDFKQWFGASQVVDASGEPLVLSHGTDAVFSEFKYGEFGFHFGCREQAKKRGEFVMDVHLRITNLIIFDTDFSTWDEDYIAPYLVERGVITEDEMAQGDLQGLLMAKGYDGYSYPNGYEGGGVSYAVFSPEQIKSVHHVGLYDASSADVYGKAVIQPSTTPTSPLENASPAANGQTVAENFTAWFGASQMLDEHQQPLRLFHGTRVDFDEFRNGQWLAGLFFTPDPAYAGEMAKDDEPIYSPGAVVLPVYLRMTHPLDLTQGLDTLTLARLQAAGLPLDSLGWIDDPKSEHCMAFDKSAGGTEFIDVVAKAGFDGVIFNENESSIAYAVFSPTQLKSAIGNSGLYVIGSASLTDRAASIALERVNEARLAIEVSESRTKSAQPRP